MRPYKRFFHPDDLEASTMGYSVLSKYRTELMGVAILWVMLFHSFDLDMGLPVL